MNSYDPSYAFECPLWLMRREEVNPYAKLVYSVLYTLAQGSFELIVQLDYDYLSKLLGFQKTRSRNWVWKLDELKLISVGSFADSPCYRLCPHPWIGEHPAEPVAETKSVQVQRRHLSLVP